MSGELDAEAPQEGGLELTNNPAASVKSPASKNLQKGCGDRESAEGHSPEPRGLLHKTEIIEGKREKKSVQRLDLQLGKPKEPVKIEEGKGMKLGEIVQVAYNIGRLKAEELKPLHKILFNRPGAAASLKKNIRQFSGFTFEANSEPYMKKREVVKRLTLAGLKTICTILDLENNGTHDVRVDRILTFLLNPKTRARPLPKKRKKPTSSKSKAIVDSSSDDEDGRSDKDRGPVPKSRETIDDDDSTSDDDDDEDDDNKGAVDGNMKEEDDNTTDKDPMRKTPIKQKALATKKMAAKKSFPAKKTATSRKVVAGKKKTESIKAVTLKQKSKTKATKTTDEEGSDPSDVSVSDSRSDHIETQKSAKKRPAAKTKKADSSSSKMSSNKEKGSNMEEDSSDDEPLIKMLKRPPTDDQLRETINRLLKEADLEEVTMKQVYKKVFEFYPEHDLTSRKAFIKETVKNLIS